MKKFSFSLQRLLRYKEQVFDIEQSILADMNAVMHQMKDALEHLQREHVTRSKEFNEKAASGTTVVEMQRHKHYMTTVDEAIVQKKLQIELQKQAIDKQTDKVREAKIEISTMEKLKEKKLEEYNHLATKAQELFIEEFVSNAKATALEAEIQNNQFF